MDGFGVTPGDHARCPSCPRSVGYYGEERIITRLVRGRDERPQSFRDWVRTDGPRAFPVACVIAHGIANALVTNRHRRGAQFGALMAARIVTAQTGLPMAGNWRAQRQGDAQPRRTGGLRVRGGHVDRGRRDQFVVTSRAPDSNPRVRRASIRHSLKFAVLGLRDAASVRLASRRRRCRRRGTPRQA